MVGFTCVSYSKSTPGLAKPGFAKPGVKIGLIVGGEWNKIPIMSGHSKWKNIQRTKNATDAKRGKVFTKLANNITIATKKGGGDPDGNPSLRMAIDIAKKANMPKDNIDRAIKRGLGIGVGRHVEEVRYEGYAFGGIAVMVDVLTDNKNRATADIRLVFSRNGGSLGEPGSASYVFGSDPSNPSYKIPIENKEKFFSFVAELEELDDVSDVYHNGIIQ